MCVFQKLTWIGQEPVDAVVQKGPQPEPLYCRSIQGPNPDQEKDREKLAGMEESAKIWKKHGRETMVDCVSLTALARLIWTASLLVQLD